MKYTLFFLLFFANQAIAHTPFAEAENPKEKAQRLYGKHADIINRPDAKAIYISYPTHLFLYVSYDDNSPTWERVFDMAELNQCDWQKAVMHYYWQYWGF